MSGRPYHEVLLRLLRLCEHLLLLAVNFAQRIHLALQQRNILAGDPQLQILELGVPPYLGLHHETVFGVLVSWRGLESWQAGRVAALVEVFEEADLGVVFAGAGRGARRALLQLALQLLHLGGARRLPSSAARSRCLGTPREPRRAALPFLPAAWPCASPLRGLSRFPFAPV